MALPTSTELFLHIPFEGIIFSAHTVHSFEQREKNTSYLAWWGNSCYGLTNFTDLSSCSHPGVAQQCLLEEKSNMFAHSLFFANGGQTLDTIRYSDQNFTFTDTPPHTVQIKSFETERYYQTRDNIYATSLSPILPDSQEIHFRFLSNKKTTFLFSNINQNEFENGTFHHSPMILLKFPRLWILEMEPL